VAGLHERPLLNLNTASEAELQRLPGVGPSLAARIVAARPFATIDDLRRVPGIGPAALAELRDRLTLDEAREAPAPAGAQVFVREASERMEQALEAAGARWSSVTGGRRLMVDAGLVGLAVVLSLFSTLLVLAGINGSLDVSRQRSVLQLVGEVSALQTRAESLQSKADSIEGRLQALDGLTGRMSAVEDQVERMQAELEAASADVAAMQSDVDTLSAEVGELRQDMERVDSFLRGLRDLLTALYPQPTPPSSTPTP
jgi:competence ComEA-like helix-hairpin-helix protein